MYKRQVQSFHHKLEGAAIFSKIDLVKEYHLIPFAPEDVEKTAICSPLGSLEYIRMAFALRNSVSTSQRFIDNTIRELPYCLAYLDDVLVFSDDASSHEVHLNKLLGKIQSNGLKVNEKRCEFRQQPITFLGYEVDKAGICPPKARIDALLNLKHPRDKKRTGTVHWNV